MTARLNDYKALTFDCYGTLIDWETGIWDALQPLILANGAPSVERRQALHLFGELEHAEQKANPGLLYPGLLANVHRGIAERLGFETTSDLDDAFGESVPHWPAFADSAESLRFLKKHYRLVILSNVDNAGIAASIRKLGVEFDAVYTAEDVGSYKPADANFRYLLARMGADFGLRKDDILHTAQSLLHDHMPARKFGLANAWIDRQRLSETGETGVIAVPGERPETDYAWFTLAEMVEAVRAESD